MKHDLYTVKSENPFFILFFLFFFSFSFPVGATRDGWFRGTEEGSKKKISVCRLNQLFLYSDSLTDLLQRNTGIRAEGEVLKELRELRNLKWRENNIGFLLATLLGMEDFVYVNRARVGAVAYKQVRSNSCNVNAAGYDEIR